MAQAVRVVRVVFEHGETVSVILVQPVPSAKPHKALSVLENTVDAALRKPLFHRDPFKLYLIPLCVNFGRQAWSEQNHDEQNDDA